MVNLYECYKAIKFKRITKLYKTQQNTQPWILFVWIVFNTCFDLRDYFIFLRILDTEQCYV